eukprot:scaffold1158_cov66-Phaeocystis_antarctica.AAC.5
MLEQQTHRGVMAIRHSNNESSGFLVPVQVDAGTALQQLRHHAQVPTTRGRVQQLPVVHMPARLLQPLDNRLQLATFRRA